MSNDLEVGQWVKGREVGRWVEAWEGKGMWMNGISYCIGSDVYEWRRGPGCVG